MTIPRLPYATLQSLGVKLLGACRLTSLDPDEAAFWTFATAKWDNEEVDTHNMNQKELDKLASTAAALFVAERVEKSAN